MVLSANCNARDVCVFNTANWMARVFLYDASSRTNGKFPSWVQFTNNMKTNSQFPVSETKEVIIKMIG